MIYGIGTDIVRVDRLRTGLARFGPRLVARVLHAAEVADFRACADPARFLAKRWAAKEALVKALRTGVRDGITLKQIAITHDALGRPGACYHAAIAERIRLAGITASHVSISDEADHVVAFAILEV